MMNFNKSNVKMTVFNTNYYFNGDNVTAEVNVCLDAPEKFYELFGNCYMIVKAVAKCSPYDKYSLEKGKQVARAKAEGRAYRLIKNELIRRWNSVIDTMESLAPLKANFIEKAENCEAHNKEYVKRITGDTF